jgi:RimJ/RimL family protein N-acetyltransferase
VRLREFRPDESELLLDRLRHWLPDAVAANEAFFRAQIEKRVADSGRWSDDDELQFALEVDGHLTGAVQALSRYHGLPPAVYELGIEFYRVEDRGRGLGSEVLRLFLPQVFEHGAIRLQGHTHVENEAMIRLFERFSFVREGVLRNYMPLPERCGDVVLYGLTARDYERMNLSRRSRSRQSSRTTGSPNGLKSS